ncbi:MAG: hypothetical protein ACXWWY_11785 [Candidatus Deferrimicrobiaceae bacterium]
MSLKLHDTNLAVMEQLGVFRFLTRPQLARLGVADRTSLQRIFARFRNERPRKVESVSFAVVRREGGFQKVHQLHHLTPAGAECLADITGVDIEEISFPRSPIFQRDYWHRVAMVDFHIETVLYCRSKGFSLDFFHTCYQTAGANRTPGLLRGKSAAGGEDGRLRRLTKVRSGRYHFFPDIVLAVTAPAGTRYFYAVEVHNGMDTKRILDKLVGKYMPALDEGSISEAFGQPKSPMILVVFEGEAALRSFLERIHGIEHFWKDRRLFAFSTIARLKEDYAFAWQFAGGAVGSIFHADGKIVGPDGKPAF